MTYIVTIAEITDKEPSLDNGDTGVIEQYRRRVEMPDVNAVIERLDAALKVRVRKPRSDAGKTREAKL